jgi:hypothetical protein
MALASDAEYWYFIVSENCVCDIMQNLLCSVNLTKGQLFGLNRSGWNIDVWNWTNAASEWQQNWLHQTN